MVNLYTNRDEFWKPFETVQGDFRTPVRPHFGTPGVEDDVGWKKINRYGESIALNESAL